jgi:hypothetical protein
MWLDHGFLLHVQGSSTKEQAIQLASKVGGRVREI